MKALTWLSGRAPTKPSTGWPPEKAMTAGNRLDAELAGDRRMLVDVHLDQAHGAAGGAHRLLDDRPERAAGPAPRRPEIDQHRLAGGFLDDVLGEGLGGGVLDEVAAWPFSAGVAPLPVWGMLMLMICSVLLAPARGGGSRVGGKHGASAGFLQFAGGGLPQPAAGRGAEPVAFAAPETI